MTTTAYINIALETFGALLSLIFIICLIFAGRNRERLDRLYIGVLLCNALVLTFDAAAWILKGGISPLHYYGVRIANFGVFTLGYLLLAVFTEYLICFLSTRQTGISRRPVKIMWKLTVLAILLVVVSQFSHMYYLIDSQNFYHRQPWFWLSQVFGILCMLINGMVLFKNRTNLEKSEFLSLMTYIVMPVAAMMIQILCYGIAVLYLATTISAMCIYISIQAEQSRKISQKEIELTQSRTAVVLSQIQPHFLYNALNTIHYLCRTQPEKAAAAVEDFSDYLRGNMDALTRQSPIPFEQELVHLKHYLALEKLRFPYLQIHYELKEHEFFLPTLTLQPLVENAIRYGATQRRDESGTVTISTWRDGKNYCLSIEDNGNGFDARQQFEDGRSHIGISNTRQRLKSMCNGVLTVESRHGQGTRILITIPGEEELL